MWGKGRRAGLRRALRPEPTLSLALSLSVCLSLSLSSVEDTKLSTNTEVGPPERDKTEGSQEPNDGLG